MARYILFRGKRIDNGEWVNGYVTRIKHSSDKGKIESYYFNALDELGWVAECVVSAETVCQYTGLTDKNRRKIFEGDILKRVVLPTKRIESNFRIAFVPVKSCFSAIDLDGSNVTFISDYINCNFEIEVIGNVFDNPELVKNPKCSECKCRNCFSKSECCPECEGAISGCEEYSETDIYNPDLEGETHESHN